MSNFAADVKSIEDLIERAKPVGALAHKKDDGTRRAKAQALAKQFDSALEVLKGYARTGTEIEKDKAYRLMRVVQSGIGAHIQTMASGPTPQIVPMKAFAKSEPK